MKKVLLGICIGVCGTAAVAFTSPKEVPAAPNYNRGAEVEILKKDIMSNYTIYKIMLPGKAIPVYVFRDIDNGGVCTL